MKQMPPNIQHILFSLMWMESCIAYHLHFAATYFRGGGSLNCIFFLISFLNLTMKNYENRYTVAEVIMKIKVVHFLRHGIFTIYVHYRRVASTGPKSWRRHWNNDNNINIKIFSTNSSTDSWHNTLPIAVAHEWGFGKIPPVDVATMWSYRPYYRSVVNTMMVGLPLYQ